MKKMIGCLCLLLTGVCSADILLLQDTFTAANTNDINYNLASRQSGTQATVNWTDSVANNYQTQLDGGALRVYKDGAAGTVFARLNKDFAAIASHVRIGVDVRCMNPADGFAMVNIGTNNASANLGYSFRLDVRAGTAFLNFYDNGTQKGGMDVSSIIDTNSFASLMIDFQGGNTLSAAINGTAYVFDTGSSYTGSAQANNYVTLSWYGDGSPAPTSAKFDNLSITSIPEPTTLSLFVVSSIGLFSLRQFIQR
jgi:hypothetical protein